MYPAPPVRTTTLIIFPPLTIALRVAPTPSPSTFRSGADEYSVPGLVTCTETTFPPEINGFNSAFLPFLILMSGF